MTHDVVRLTVRCTYRNTYRWNSPLQFSPFQNAFSDRGQQMVSYHLRNSEVPHTHMHNLVIGRATKAIEKIEGIEDAEGEPYMSEAKQLSQPLSKMLYSVSEAAEVLSCSRNTVYAFMRSGQLLAVYPTSKARISKASLERFVQILEIEARSSKDFLRRSVK